MPSLPPWAKVLSYSSFCNWSTGQQRSAKPVIIEWLFFQSPSHVGLFTTPWTAACQASLCLISESLPKFMSIESVMSSNHIYSAALFFCLQSFPASGSFPMSLLFILGGQSIEASTSASVLPVSIQSWFPLEWIGWISLQSKGLSRVFSNTTVWKHQFFSALPSLWSNSHIWTWLLERP